MSGRWARSRRSGSAALAVVGLVLVGGCKSEQGAAVTNVQAVQVARVQSTSGGDAWSYVGTLRPRYESDIAFRVGGKVTRRLVDVGAAIVPGQVIAELDATDFRLAVEAQQAELAAARSSREQAVAAEARFRILESQGHVAKAALDQRVAAADEARGRVERAERMLALARNQLDYAVLRSDTAGVVSALPVEVGQVVGAGQPIARIARRDAIEALVAVPENRLADVRSAQAEVEIWAAGDRRYPARVREVAPEAERVTRTYAVRFSFGPGADAAELGRTATVHLRAASTASTFRVPISAVMQDGTSPSVWVLDENASRVRRVPVQLTHLTHDAAVIAGAMRSGDRIVTLGVHMLDADKPVRIVEERVAAR